MARRFWFGFAPVVLVAAMVAACGDEAGSVAPGFAEGPPGIGAAGSGGAVNAPGAPGAPAAAGSVGQTASNETPNAGLDGAPIDAAGSSGSGGVGGSPASGDESMGGMVAVAGNAAVGGATSAGGAASVEETPPTSSVFPSSVTRPRLLIIGDSISAGQGCYKKYLLAALNTSGLSNFDFVGEYTDDCGGGVMHGARSCSTAQDYTQPTFTLPADCGGTTWPGLSALAAEHRPDLLMIQLGVNDVWRGVAVESILASYTALVEQARAQNPNVVLAVAQIHQIRPMDAGGAATFARAQQLVEAVPAWAAAQSQAQSPVFVADLWTNSNVAETTDGVHPNDAGAQRMGQNWFNALSLVLPRN